MASVMINLLPDVRVAKLRAKQERRLATALTSVVIGLSLGVVALLFLITQGQNIKLASLQSQIDQKQSEINNVPNLGKILTTQQHLASLPQLYQQRVYLSKFFIALSAVSPKDLSLQKMEIDAQNGIKFTAQARNYGIATKFAKALEASNQTKSTGVMGGGDFTQIKLQELTSDKDGKVNFSLTTTVSTGVSSGQ